jgi:hypothetical protein
MNLLGLRFLFLYNAYNCYDPILRNNLAAYETSSIINLKNYLNVILEAIFIILRNLYHQHRNQNHECPAIAP